MHNSDTQELLRAGVEYGFEADEKEVASRLDVDFVDDESVFIIGLAFARGFRSSSLLICLMAFPDQWRFRMNSEEARYNTLRYFLLIAPNIRTHVPKQKRPFSPQSTRKH